VVVEFQAKKVSLVQGLALREPAVEGHRQQQWREEAVAPFLRTQRWRHARAFACDDGNGGASRLQCQSRREWELVYCT
jgi:hypothetical protein